MSAWKYHNTTQMQVLSIEFVVFVVACLWYDMKIGIDWSWLIDWVDIDMPRCMGHPCLGKPCTDAIVTGADNPQLHRCRLRLPQLPCPGPHPCPCPCHLGHDMGWFVTSASHGWHDGTGWHASCEYLMVIERMVFLKMVICSGQYRIKHGKGWFPKNKPSQK